MYVMTIREYLKANVFLPFIPWKNPRKYISKFSFILVVIPKQLSIITDANTKILGSHRHYIIKEGGTNELQTTRFS